MASEPETASSAAGRNVGDGSDATMDCSYETSGSNSSNGGWGRGRRERTGRGSHQGRGRRGRLFNRPLYTYLIRNFKGEVKDFGAVLGTMS